MPRNATKCPKKGAFWSPSSGFEMDIGKDFLVKHGAIDQPYVDLVGDHLTMQLLSPPFLVTEHHNLMAWTSRMWRLLAENTVTQKEKLPSGYVKIAIENGHL
jgi:hypothetical protein